MIDNINLLKHKLAHASGSDSLWHNMIKSCNYTDGIKEYLKLAQCRWFYDIVQTEFHSAVMKLQADTYYIKLEVEGTTALITMTNYKKELLHYRHVEFTDHVEGVMDFHFGWDGSRSILCLPSEN